MNRNEEIKLDFFMSRIKHLEDIKETEKTKISVVLYEATRTTCILRVCKNRNLSAVCDALLQVKNPNVALVYQYVYAGGNTYILEEMLSGKTIDKIIEDKGLFSEIETAKIISEVCSGLADFHKMQPPVIHNDINTSNIMICDDNRVKLFDFDISRTYKKEASKNTELFGTEEYASPEHYGYGQSEPRTDIYSLGVTMHRMLCGEYLSGNRKCLYKGRMKKIIEKCIEIDPKKRYTSVLHLNKDLEKVLNRKKTAIKLIALLLAVAVLFVGAYLVFEKHFNGNTSLAPQDETINQISTENSNDIVPQTTNIQQGEDIKKLTVAEKLDGELLSLTSLNNGTMVYLEKTSDEYHIKSSLGTDKILPTTLAIEECELLYNTYTDSLYIVTTNNDKGYIYSLSKDFEIDSTPVYSAPQSYTSDIKGMFFSDGMLYCDAFGKDLIDTDRWCQIGSANCSPVAVANDRIYDISNNFYMLDELSVDGDCLNQYEIPGDTLFDRVCFADSNTLYLTVKKNNKGYVHSFDGEVFSEFVCLSDYQHYTDFKCSAMTVTQNKIWMYDSEMNAIKEFTI